MFIADITNTYTYSFIMLYIPDSDTFFVYWFWHDLACGSHGDCGVFILSTFLALRFLRLMNNWHVVLDVFQNFEHISTFVTYAVFLVVVMFFLHTS